MPALSLRRGIACLTLLLAVSGLPLAPLAAFEASGKLEIHYINIGQGGSTLIIGPNGTRILYDFGNRGGDRDIVPYLRDTLGLAPADGLHYAIISHYDRDHYFGYRDLVEADYDVLVANFQPSDDPPDKTTLETNWLAPARDTAAGAARGIPVGLRISLGDGAEVFVVAADGRVFGDPDRIEVLNENDRSIALFVRYRNFHYLLDGDLGAGAEVCTDHDTTQQDVQTKVAAALLSLGEISAEEGVDVLHIAHHGSESSTSAAYFNLMKPEVGLISVGLNQGTFLHPRRDVVDRVLIGNNRASCVTAPPLAALFQTEEGVAGCSSTGCTSFTGQPVGDIKLSTDGITGYEITATGRVHGGNVQQIGVLQFPLDESLP